VDAGEKKEKLNIYLMGILFLNLMMSIPALLGDWVTDDFTMLGHPLMDDLGDVWGAFFSNSDDYLFVGKGRFMSMGSTYRPLSMGSLVLVNVLFGYNALAHHVLSWLLHGVNIYVLCRLCWSQVRVEWGLVLMSAAVAMHPSLCEAYDWINGRSDVLAGTFWVLLAWWLWGRDRALEPAQGGGDGVGGGQVSGWVGFGVSLLLVAGGLFSKSVFGLAAATVLAVVCLPPAGAAWDGSLVGRTLRRAWGLRGELAGALGGVALYVVMKGVSGQGHAATQQSVLGLFDAEFFGKVPQMVGKGAGALVELSPRTMRLLAWDLYQPWSVLEVVGFAGVCAGLVALLWRRRHRELVWVLGALGVFVPVLIVSEHFWLGFDRYLYLPVLMLSVPGARLWALVAERWPWRRSLLVVVAGVALLLSSASKFLTATHYNSQEAFVASMARYRPEDPTGGCCGRRSWRRRGACRWGSCCRRRRFLRMRRRCWCI
jgi:hypothetical protein